MIWIIIAVAGLVSLIVIVFVSSGSLYKRIFAPEHYVEFAQSMSVAKARGCDQINEAPGNQPIDDPRVFVTTAGVTVMYTVDAEDGEYIHHYSISIAGRYTPAAVGRTCTVYVARLLCIDPADLRVGISQASVHHAEFTLSENEQREFEDRDITIPSIEFAREIHVECRERSFQLQWEHIHVDSCERSPKTS
jgi:hypothetical protein